MKTFPPFLLAPVAHYFHSDGKDPKTLTEQVLSIHPILSGQKTSSGNTIPSKPAESHPAESKAAPARAAPATTTRDDLIDCGTTHDGPAETSQATRPAATVNPTVESTGEISGLLKATGKPANGPLLDFSQDMKKDIPEIREPGVESGEDLKK